MKCITICIVALSVFAISFVPMSSIGQTIIGDRIIYPPEMSPLVRWHPRKTQRPLVPQGKFVKVQNAIPNKYIVVLNDDLVPSDTPLEIRRAQITAIARSHALAHLGNVESIYETALKGYSIELPSEAAARLLSDNPKVRWVEEDGLLNLAQSPESFQSNPPWGLDFIDGSFSPPPDATGRTNGLYIYNADGSGVNAYVLDTGINTAHQDFSTGFFSRAQQAADCVRYANCQSGTPSPYTDSLCAGGTPNSTNNDCWGHGTFVAGILGGNTYGVAKFVTIRSVKVCLVNFGCPDSLIIQGVNWVTNDHLANPGVRAVANMSFAGPRGAPGADPTAVDLAVVNSINSGVTYVVVGGPNNNDDSRNNYPSDVASALTVAAVDYTGTRWSNSNWGPGVDLFAPGVFVLSALSGNNMPAPCHWFGNDNESCTASGQSAAVPHVTGAVAMYLQGRPSMVNCNGFPIQGPSSPSMGATLSTCPDRVQRFIDSNARLNSLNPSQLNSPNRHLLTVSIPTTTTPVDNQRFFTWQQYSDFLPYDPDEGGLDFWTWQITSHCGTGFNDNNACVREFRTLVSKEFFRVAFPSAFNNNSEFVHRCYEAYLRRSVPDSDGGFQFWLGQLNSFGSPASEAGKNALIDAFITSSEYRRRFGQP